MNPLDIARLTAAGRIAIGTGFVTAPGFWMRTWLGGEARRPASKLLSRALGARDLVLGAGTLATLGEPRQLRRWLAAALVADAADFAATVVAPKEELPRHGRRLVLLIAGNAVILGAVALATLEERESSESAETIQPPAIATLS